MDQTDASRGSPGRTLPDFTGLPFDVVSSMIMNPGLNSGLNQLNPANAGTQCPARGAASLEESFGRASIDSAKPKEELTGMPGDVNPSGLLHLWWSLIQDQLGSFTREIESLRRANAQLESRQTQIVQFLSEQQNKMADVKQNMVAQQESVQEQLSNERVSREQQIRGAIAEVRDIISEQKADLHTLVRDTCEKEREQTKTMLSRARQILDSDEALRERLQSLLQTEMVTKAEFGETTERLVRDVKALRAPKRIGSPPKTPRSGTASVPTMPAAIQSIGLASASGRPGERSPSMPGFPGAMMAVGARPPTAPLMSMTPPVPMGMPSPRGMGPPMPMGPSMMVPISPRLMGPPQSAVRR